MIKHPKTKIDFYTKDEVATLLCMPRDQFDAFLERKRASLVEGRDFEIFISSEALSELIDDEQI